MESLPARLRKVKKSKSSFSTLFKSKQHCYFIHYSCQSFMTDGNASHRITSIAIRHVESAQTESFSIFQFAEKLSIATEDIIERYEEIEKVMLDAYFKFLNEHKQYNFIHWNMRDINYGFKALEHRGEILGCNTFKLEDNKKFDLSRLLKLRFSKKYIGHPRLKKLVDLNEITTLNFLTGEEEAKAYEDREFLKLHQSTLRKVDIMENILSRVEDNDLKVESSIADIYGLSLAGIAKAIKEHPIYVIIILLISILSAIKKFTTLLDNLF